MKELVKLGTSHGVVENTVEDVVRGLLSDRHINDDKIGSGCFFWSFPSSAFLATQARAAALEAALAGEAVALAAAEAREAALCADAQGVAERAAKLAQLDALRARRAALEAEVKASADFDPAVSAELLSKAKKVRAARALLDPLPLAAHPKPFLSFPPCPLPLQSKAAADRWTDNVLAIKSGLIKSYNMGSKEAMGTLGIGDDFDYPA